MNQADTEFDPDTIDWEYEQANADGLKDIRGYLYKRRKQGWNLFWIEGHALHFRRRLMAVAA